MMGNGLKNKFAKFIWSNTISTYTGYYLAFYSNSVNAAGSGTDITSTICGSRQLVTFTDGGTNTGEAVIASKTITVTGAGTIQSIGIWSASTGGEFVAFEDLPTPVSVVPGSWTIDAGDIKLKFT